MIYSGLQGRVHRMLQSLEWTRERKRKDEALVKLLTSHWTKTTAPSEYALVELVRDYNAADRAWRRILEENPTLRGTDYADKVKYAQKTQIELGYESNYHELSRLQVT